MPHIPNLDEMEITTDQKFLALAIQEAEMGANEGGIPIGSILVRGEEIVGRGHNRRVQDGNPVFHAEITCLHNAGRIGNYRETVLYSTLMPCYLCAGAVVQFGIPKVVVGEAETFAGAADFMRSHGVEVVLLNSAQCKNLLQTFIQKYPEVWNEDIGLL